MAFRVAVVTFPGSNCDADLRHAVDLLDGLEAVAVWHKERSLPAVDAVMLPGGFSYGDYLRCGALARFSPVMDAVVSFARSGGPVLGICNGFQILTEAGLLPGALIRNAGLKFLCQPVHVRVEGRPTPFTAPHPGALRIPIAHMEGNWVAQPEEVRRVEEEGQVVLRYVDPSGRRVEGIAPNGSTNDVAGVCSPEGNVVGMMPHPERAMEDALGGTDGRVLLGALRTFLEGR